MLRLFFLTAFFVVVDSYTKEWIHTNLWNDASNWQPPYLPCIHGNVQMKDGAVFISNGTSLPSVIGLAGDGEIIFPTNSVVNLGPSLEDSEKKDKKTCLDSVFLYNRRSWYNPNNWKIARISNDLIPFIERVPCADDEVKFPKHGGFSVTIDGDIQVRSLLLRGEKVSNEFLREYMNTTMGRENFILGKKGRLNITTNACPNEGCLCKNYKESSRICNSFQCPPITCQKKVWPYKDCCPTCGAILLFTFNQKFHFNQCREAVRRNIQSTNTGMYMSRIMENKIQILFTDQIDGSYAEKTMKHVAKVIKSQDHACDVEEVKEKTWKDFTASAKSESVNTTTITLATILPLIVIVTIIVLLAIYYKRKNPKEIKSVRFDNKTMDEYPGFNEIVTTDFMTNDTQDLDESMNYKRLEAEDTVGKSDDEIRNKSEHFEMEDPDFSNTVLDVGIMNPLYELQKNERKQKERIQETNDTIEQSTAKKSTVEDEYAVLQKVNKAEDITLGFTNPVYECTQNGSQDTATPIDSIKTMYDEEFAVE